MKHIEWESEDVFWFDAYLKGEDRVDGFLKEMQRPFYRFVAQVETTPVDPYHPLSLKWQIRGFLRRP